MSRVTNNAVRLDSGQLFLSGGGASSSSPTGSLTLLGGRFNLPTIYDKSGRFLGSYHVPMFEIQPENAFTVEFELTGNTDTIVGLDGNYVSFSGDGTIPPGGSYLISFASGPSGGTIYNEIVYIGGNTGPTETGNNVAGISYLNFVGPSTVVAAINFDNGDIVGQDRVTVIHAGTGPLQPGYRFGLWYEHTGNVAGYIDSRGFSGSIPVTGSLSGVPIRFVISGFPRQTAADAVSVQYVVERSWHELQAPTGSVDFFGQSS